MTATQQDVMLALLALDSDSRGTVRQLEVRGNPLNVHIGTAVWTDISDDIPGALQAGFSASSYTLAAISLIAEHSVLALLGFCCRDRRCQKK